jgi:hypothetical protein
VSHQPDGYAYPEPYYAPGWQEAPTVPWDGVSIAALVTGVVGLGPVPVVLGAIGAGRTAGRRRRGRWMAWVGLTLGVLSILSWLALGGVAWLLLRPLPADVTAPRFALASQLTVGNCVSTLPPDGQVWAVRVVPCSGAHAARVVVRQDLTNPPAGQTRLDEASSQLCGSQPLPAGSGRLVVWAPTPGRATVTCLVTTAAAPAGLSGT